MAFGATAWRWQRGWLSWGVALVVMESTGIYWKSVYAHLENAGVRAWVVNAHSKHSARGTFFGGKVSCPRHASPSPSHIAHRQMPERELERVMRDFIAQRHNVLLCWGTLTGPIR